MVDIFYKPPIQDPNECNNLEENYMNCLMQKALKDKVVTNKCVLDSVLWFHLECPKAAAKFDDPIHFRAKWRKFLGQQKHAYDLLFNYTDEEKQIERDLGAHLYPEDIKENKSLRAFVDDFKEHTPIYNPPEAGEDWENPYEGKDYIDKNTHYTKKGNDAISGPPLEVSASKRFGGDQL